MYKYFGENYAFLRLPKISEVNMAKKSIAEDVERFCVFCEYGTPVPSDNDEELVICAKKGLIRGGKVCRKFSYDPLKREPARRPVLPETEEVNIDEL